MLFALRALLSTGGLEGAEALERLSALFRREAEGWVEVDFTDWGSGEQERENFRIVREGILGRRLLDFTYYASSGTRTRRRVEPGKLVFKSGCWYLQAFCLARRDWRIFRLARMEGLCLEREGFPPRRPPEQLEVPSPEQRQNGTLTLRFAPSAAWRVRDYFAPGQIRAGEDGCLLGFLLSFGDQVEVFAPASWREVLGRTGKKIAALYETGHSVSGIQAYPEGTEEGSTPPEQKEEPDMEERIFCQCCGMPLDAPEDMGSNADGSPNRDYCRWCYQRGAFTAPEMDFLRSLSFAIVFVNSDQHNYEFDQIQVDFDQGLKQMAAYLLDKKQYRGIGYIGGVYEHGGVRIGGRRLSGLRRILEERGLYDPTVFHVGDISRESGYTLARQAAREGRLAEAMLLGSDEVAEGALEAFRELGLRVPKDVAVIIYQDIQTLESKWPTGTCIEMFPDYIWENALEILFGRISQKRTQAVTVVVPTHIRIGDTA